MFFVTKDEAEGNFYADIDGKHYRFHLWGAEKALDIGLQLAAILAEPLKRIGTSIEDAVDDEGNATIQILATATGALFAALGEKPAQATSLIKTLATLEVTCDGKELTSKGFDMKYRGNLNHLRKVVAAAVEVQFHDFFDEISPAFLAAREAVRRKRAAREAHTRATAQPIQAAAHP